ncbi:YndJ family protein [Metabacillus sp. SLBN-84]
MNVYKSALLCGLMFLLAAAFHEGPWYYLLLTAAQLVYVPLVLQLVMQKEDWFYKLYKWIAPFGFGSVLLLHILGPSPADPILAGMYLLFTVLVASYGITRFLKRGFVRFEEFSIDMGLISLMIGGGWFFAHIAGIETGFSPIITWLTGIHFHYSSFLLPIFAGFLGRILKGTVYRAAVSILIISPGIVAAGIAFSVWLELFSVVLYITGIYALIWLSFKADIPGGKWLIRLSFLSLGITILFSLAYASGNAFGEYAVSIDFMLKFHGVLNGGGFALAGVIGWHLFKPAPAALPSFPVSKIRGRQHVADLAAEAQIHQGLVDDMKIYGTGPIPETIVDFYEHTKEYSLFAEVHWHRWFKPFAYIYHLISSRTEQIHLPLSSDPKEMTGGIYTVKEGLDGRKSVRAWHRQIDGKTVFLALYSYHQKDGETYMNIALPLPGCSMIGILELHKALDALLLTSRKQNPSSDAGIYLAWKDHLFKLPFDEVFRVEETEKGKLAAIHQMKIARLPFLTIRYNISKNEGSF